MKMRDVFELPVEACESFDDFYVRGCKELNLIDEQAHAAARAINCFDGLVDGLDDALSLLIKVFDSQKSDFDKNSITLEDLGRIHELLTRAKGGWDE